MNLNALYGLTVTVSPYVLDRQVHKVERWPTKKKRRGYRVVLRSEPQVLFLDGRAFVNKATHALLMNLPT